MMSWKANELSVWLPLDVTAAAWLLCACLEKRVRRSAVFSLPFSLSSILAFFCALGRVFSGLVLGLFVGAFSHRFWREAAEAIGGCDLVAARVVRFGRGLGESSRSRSWDGLSVAFLVSGDDRRKRFRVLRLVWGLGLPLLLASPSPSPSSESSKMVRLRRFAAGAIANCYEGGGSRICLIGTD
ncbi:hypothetical protein B0T22DRAFT_454954 [Podospora appendiculata]|uniref:Uncharacterized protein n=1 Tax=Podospora appendiculata TaxID=314037 RepID=A0AAE0XKW5_9PEZI|nr:hypothetical protein B0T22DRAFT_454954 [Podospora appendiculata]